MFTIRSVEPELKLHNPSQPLPPLITIASPSFGDGAKQVASAMESWSLGARAYTILDAYLDSAGNSIGNTLQFRPAPNTAVLLPPLMRPHGAAIARNFNAVGIPMVAVVKAQTPGCSPPEDRWRWVANLVPESVLLISVGSPGHATPKTCLQTKGIFVARVELT